MLLLTATITAAAWLVGGGAMFVIARHVSEGLFDQRLQDFSQALMAFAGHELDEIQQADDGAAHRFSKKALAGRYRYQIWSKEGGLLLATVGAPAKPMAPLEVAGFSTQEVAGQAMRVFVLATDDGTKRLEVAELLSARFASLDASLALLAVPPVLSLMALVGLSAWLVRRATGGLRESARQVTQRSPNDLRPLVVASPPAELAPIIAAVNSLFARIESALEAERRFTSAAAHELRTPLATIKTQAQVALLTSIDADRTQVLQRLLTSIDRAARMIEQLLTMSRIDGLLALRAKAIHLQLDSLVSHVIDEERPILRRRDQVIVEELTAADIEGLEFCIAVLVRNLIDNAIRYGPVGGKIRVRTGTRGMHSYISVEDEGPGIAPEQREGVFERFSRLRTNLSAEGCGIGLSIVQAVVEMHRGQIDLGGSELGGLMVTVCFPIDGALSESKSVGAEARAPVSAL